ncbi:MAG TPA: phosphatase PAP2 family protein [Tepidisphaeraceae bacterium]|jgi:membrane-associated phospholipid phosphatase
MNKPPASIWGRGVCQWRLKLVLATVLVAAYCSGYLLIERHLWREPVRFNLSPIDRWIAFSTGWVWVYQSIYLLVLFPFLATLRDDLKRYGIGFVLMTAAAFGWFVLFPVLGPRVPVAKPSGMYGLLIGVDLPFNTFPSLHMAVATYSACVAIRVTDGSLNRIFKIVFPLWILLIGYSALATKQHYAIDLPAGVLLGWIAQYAAWERVSRARDADSVLEVASANRSDH